MVRRRKANAIFFACLFPVFAFQGMSKAAEWSATPSIKLQETYDDNILLTTRPHDAVTSTWVTPHLDFGVASDIWQVGGGAEVGRRSFPGHSELDANFQNFNLGSSYRTERNTWQLNASSSKTSFLTEGIVSPNTGLFTQNNSSDTKTVSPSWTWSMTELAQLQMTYSQSDVSYVSGQSVGIFDYRASTASVTLLDQFDEYTQIFLSPSYSVFRVPATTLESKAPAYQLGVTRTFTETLQGTLSLGKRRTTNTQEVTVCTLFFGPFCLQSTQGSISSRSSSSLFSGKLQKQFETTNLAVAVSRSFDPTAYGQQARTDTVSLNLSRPLAPTWTGNLAVSGYRVSSGTGIVANIDHRLYQVQPGLAWQWAPEGKLDIGYSYTHLHNDGQTTAATDNALYVTLSYQWPRFTISR